jgi:hypothetical protein
MRPHAALSTVGLLEILLEFHTLTHRLEFGADHAIHDACLLCNYYNSKSCFIKI